MSRPEVSVVIPSYQRETRLAFALDALAEQTLARDRFEVIVVRAEAAGGMLARAPEGLRVLFLTSPVAGAAAQRNVGWRAAGAPLVAFTDDDCRPAPAWLEHLLAAEPGPETIVQGRTEPDPDERDLLHGFARSVEVSGYDPWSPTCNIAYPRALIERLGGFDETFPGAAWGEDTDLALRARAGGALQRYAPGALVWHAVHPRSFIGAAGEAVRRNTVPLVIARHPRHRQVLYLRLFIDPNHAGISLALAGLLVARRWPLLAVGAMLPYLYRRLDKRHTSPRAVARYLVMTAPRVGLLDAIEVLALAVASIRCRTPVL